MNKKGLLANLIGGFIVLLIGFALIPTIMETVENAITNITIQGNLTAPPEGSWGMTMINLVPLFFVLAILTVAVAMGYQGLRSAGLIGGSDPYDLNGDGKVDDDEEMLRELEKGEKNLPDYEEEEEEVEELTEAEEDLNNYKRRNKQYHETVEKDIKKEVLYNEEETNVNQLSETKKGLDDYRDKIKKFKDKMNKSKKNKDVLEEDLEKSKFD